MASEKPNPDDPIGSNLIREDASLAGIVKWFVEGIADRLTAMEEALHESDFDALRIAAHQLKGTGGGYGYPLLTERAAELEQHARDAVLEDCKKAFEELKRLCAQIVVDPS